MDTGQGPRPLPTCGVSTEGFLPKSITWPIPFWNVPFCLASTVWLFDKNRTVPSLPRTSFRHMIDGSAIVCTQKQLPASLTETVICMLQTQIPTAPKKAQATVVKADENQSASSDAKVCWSPSRFSHEEASASIHQAAQLWCLPSLRDLLLFITCTLL